MKIKKNMYEKIINQVNELPPETGGILGGSKDEVVAAEFDRCETGQKMCSYTPNVNYLNTMIELWEKRNINFMGIFHSHHFGVESLSEGDKKYIDTIMKNMPKNISHLYFPIVVMPNRDFVVYKAYKCQEEIMIERENLEIV